MVNTELEYGRPWADDGDMPAHNGVDLRPVRVSGLQYQFEYGQGSAGSERLVGAAMLGSDARAAAYASDYDAVIVPRSARSEAEWRATIDTVECVLRVTVPRDVFDALAQMARAGVPVEASASLRVDPTQVVGGPGNSAYEGRGWGEADEFESELPIGRTVRGDVEHFAFGQDARPARPRSTSVWTKAIFAFVVLVIVSGLIVGQGGF